MNDLHQDYLNGGEIIYGAKVDSVLTSPGKKRIQLEIFIGAQRIETVRIFWNDYADSVDVQVGNKTGSIKKVIENLTEKGYIFQFISFDKFGNKSLPLEVTGNVYGDVYESKLLARSYTFVSKIAGLVFTFAPAAEGNLATLVTYTNTAGVLTTITVPAADLSCTIADFKPGSQIAIKSSFGTVNGIDTFYSSTSNPATQFFSFYKKDWKILSWSDQYDSGSNGVKNIIDGTDGTRWHTNGSAYPHWVIIDMGAVRTIKQFGLWRSTMDGGGDNRLPVLIQLLISNDNVTWTDLGQFSLNNLINGEQVIPIAASPQGRYFKFVGLAGAPGNSSYMVLGDVSVYGF